MSSGWGGRGLRNEEEAIKIVYLTSRMGWAGAETRRRWRPETWGSVSCDTGGSVIKISRTNDTFIWCLPELRTENLLCAYDMTFTFETRDRFFTLIYLPAPRTARGRGRPRGDGRRQGGGGRGKPRSCRGRRPSSGRGPPSPGRGSGRWRRTEEGCGRPSAPLQIQRPCEKRTTRGEESVCQITRQKLWGSEAHESVFCDHHECSPAPEYQHNAYCIYNWFCF